VRRKAHEVVSFTQTGESSPDAIAAPEAGRRTVYDGIQPALALFVTHNGTRSWYAMLRVNGGGFEKLYLGRWPKLSVRDARTATRTAVGEAANGRSPTEEKKRRREVERLSRADRDRPTLRETFDWFLGLESKRGGERSPKTKRDYRKLLDNHLSHLADRRLDQITVEEVLDVKATLGAGEGTYEDGRGKGGEYAANRTLALLCAIYNAAITRTRNGHARFRHAGPNPATTTEVPRFREVDRVEAGKGRIPDIKLARIFREVAYLVDPEPPAKPNPHAADMLTIDLLIGNRIGRVAKMRWDELDLVDGVWRQESSTTKQRKAHVLALPPRVLDILRARRAEANGSPWVFPATRKRSQSTTTMVPPSPFWRRALERAGLADDDIRIHDLRHSAASRMIENGMTIKEVAEALGHASIQTTDKYLRADIRRLREGVNRTAESLDGIIGGDRRESA